MLDVYQILLTGTSIRQHECLSNYTYVFGDKVLLVHSMYVCVVLNIWKICGVIFAGVKELRKTRVTSASSNKS